nr:ABC transporter ATP-binding protein [uncultured Methanoregula sp.]
MLYFLFKPHKKLLVTYLLVLILFSAMDVFRVALIYPIINYGLNVNENISFFTRIFQFIIPMGINPFLAAAILLAVMTILVAIVEVLVAYLASLTYTTVRDTTDRRVFTTLRNKPFGYFAKHKQGDLVYIGQIAVDQTGNTIYNFVLFIQNLFLCLFYLSFIFLVSLEGSIIVILLGFTFIFLIKMTIFTKIYHHSSLLNKAGKTKTVIYNEFISGIKSIFITDSFDFWTRKYDTAVKNLFKSNTKVQYLQRIPSIINNFIMFLVIAVGAIGLYYFTGGNFLPYIGTFGIFLLAIYRIVPALNACQTYYGSILRFLPGVESVYLLLKEGENLSEEGKNELKKDFEFHNQISFKNVNFRYNEGLKNTINDLSFDIQKNSKIAIVGNSGAGKTTVANLLALLYEPTTGEILVDGIKIKNFNKSGYLRNLGYLGQETFIFHDTIRENIRFGLDCTDEKIVESAKLADAHDFIMATSEGYNTIIGDQGIKLSGGQRQRIAIARILLRNPKILVLDEATSSLDNRSEQRVMDAIDRVSKDMTVITIAHRLSTVQNANVVYVMKDGRICESGDHKELIKKGGEYYQLYTKQSDSNV